MLKGYAIIFGGGGGIGRETGYTFAEHGASGIVFADLNPKAAQGAAEHSKTLATNPDFRALALTVDVRDRSSIDDVVARTLQEFGRIDYSINNAGVGAKMEKSIIDLPADEYDCVHETNARGTLFVTAAVARVMLQQEERFVEGRSGRRSVGRGVIVNISSLTAQIPVPEHVQYSASKCASVGITETAAVELASKGVRVNCVLPCWVDTPMMANDFERTPELPEAIKALAPAGRMAVPEEIAEAIHFLCSPGASYIHGIRLVIDSGVSLTRGLA